jgi:hypothetical protein
MHYYYPYHRMPQEEKTPQANLKTFLLLAMTLDMTQLPLLLMPYPHQYQNLKSYVLSFLKLRG